MGFKFFFKRVRWRCRKTVWRCRKNQSFPTKTRL